MRLAFVLLCGVLLAGPGAAQQYNPLPRPTGTAVGNLVQLGDCAGTPCLPAVDGSQLTGIGGGGTPTMTVTWSATTGTAGTAVPFEVTFSDGAQRYVEVEVTNFQGATHFASSAVLAIQDEGAGSAVWPAEAMETRARLWYQTSAAGVLQAAFVPGEFDTGSWGIVVRSGLGLNVTLVTIEAPE